MANEDTRHPYTYAADMIRSIPELELGPSGVKLSRAEASKIRQHIAKALGIDDVKLAVKLSEYYQEHEKEWTLENVEKMAKFLEDRHAPHP